MKKQLLTVLTLIVGTSAFAQVGFNTSTPQTTLDITAKGGATDIDGLQAPRLTRAQLTAKGNALYGSNQTGALVYITDISGGDLVGQRVNMNAIGYYYFDGSLWQKTTSATFTEVDGIIGNEVVNATTGGALTRSGSGTAASPYTLGIPDQGITTVKIADDNVTYAKISTPVKSISANYTLLEADKGGFIYVDAASAITITVPTTLTAGFHCVIIQQSTGQVTIAGTGITSARGTKTRTQYSAVGVIKRNSTITTITGDAIN